MSYHDLFYADPLNGWPKIDEPHFLDQIYTALKPGGAFLIVDHAAKSRRAGQRRTLPAPHG